jgi:16S rRNA (adenine1518-N6/adenine1519-N6)-dimethyltransferase
MKEKEIKKYLPTGWGKASVREKTDYLCTRGACPAVKAKHQQPLKVDRDNMKVGALYSRKFSCQENPFHHDTQCYGMWVYSLRQTIRNFLEAHNLSLQKHLGQHFLVEEHVLEKIIKAADLKSDDEVLEIGSGLGILTKELLKHARHVTAIELDRGWVKLLPEYVGLDSGVHEPRLRLVHGDGLRAKLPSTPHKVVANIPYQITAPLIERLLLHPPVRAKSLTLLVQLEVAKKITDSTEMNRLQLLVKFFGKPRMVCRVSASAFLPPPDVESAVIHIECFDQLPADEETIQRALSLIKVAFHGKRKMLRSTIGHLEGGKEMMEKAGIDTTRRPATLSIEEWLGLARAKSKSP